MASLILPHAARDAYRELRASLESTRGCSQRRRKRRPDLVGDEKGERSAASRLRVPLYPPIRDWSDGQLLWSTGLLRVVPRWSCNTAAMLRAGLAGIAIQYLQKRDSQRKCTIGYSPDQRRASLAHADWTRSAAHVPAHLSSGRDAQLSGNAEGQQGVIQRVRGDLRSSR